MLFASILFVLAGVWILVYKPSINHSLFNNPFIKYGMAIADILFFGLAMFFFSQKLRDKKPGLIIDDSGITDNSSGVSAGHVPWNDIKYINVVNVMRQEFLMIVVKNPNDYLNRQSNILKRKTMLLNFKQYGSPISISTNGLNFDFDELKTILDKKLTEFRNKSGLT